MVHRGALVLVSSLLLGACAESAPEKARTVAGLAELSGPYRAEPFQAFDPVLVTLLRDACLNDASFGERQPQDLQPVLVDARGGDRFMLLMASQNEEGLCIGSLDGSGAPVVEGGSGGSGSGVGAVVGPREVVSGASGSDIGLQDWSFVHGQVGSEIGGVVLELADGSRVTASLGGGRYAAWWPNDQQAARILAYDRIGALVGETPP